MTTIECALRSKGYKLIAGVDEAGRGPLAGPVVAAAVILGKYDFIAPIRDSKKLSAKQRSRACAEIISSSIIGVGIVSHLQIDKYNIYRATEIAMTNAVMNLNTDPDYLIIDGTMTVKSDHAQESVIRGDSLSLSIAAASIVAKVTRDEIMMEYHNLYPQYGFNSHKGYGTKLHLNSLANFGACPIHRRTFAPVRNVAKGSF